MIPSKYCFSNEKSSAFISPFASKSASFVFSIAPEPSGKAPGAGAAFPIEKSIRIRQFRNGTQQEPFKY